MGELTGADRVVEKNDMALMDEPPGADLATENAGAQILRTVLENDRRQRMKAVRGPSLRTTAAGGATAATRRERTRVSLGRSLRTTAAGGAAEDDTGPPWNSSTLMGSQR